jgi:hypothetical protein
MAPALSQLSDEVSLLHQARHALAADVLTELAQVVQNARAAVRTAPRSVRCLDQRPQSDVLERAERQLHLPIGDDYIAPS